MSSDRLCHDPDEMLAADLALFCSTHDFVPNELLRREGEHYGDASYGSYLPPRPTMPFTIPAIPGTTGLARVFLIECLAQSGLTMRLSMTE